MTNLNPFLRVFLGIIAVPLIAQFLMLVVFVIEPRTFYYRAWEFFAGFSDRTIGSDSFWEGYEYGDLSRGNFFLYQKKVYTRVSTDEDGFRSVPPMSGDFDVVVAGRSNIFSSRLSDEDTYPWKLARRTGLRTFNAGKSQILRTLSRPDLGQVKVIVDCLHERILTKRYTVTQTTLRPYKPVARNNMTLFDTYKSVQPQRYMLPNIIDRSIKRIAKDIAELRVREPREYLFLPHKNKLADLPTVVDIIEQRKRVFNELGYEYLAVIIPAKQTYYADYPDAETREFGREVVRALELQGMPVVNLFDPFEANKSSGLYFHFDTHWNEKATEIAANLTAHKMQELFPQLWQ